MFFDYIPINLETVLINSILNFDLYIYYRENNSYRLYRSKNTPFNMQEKNTLIENNVKTLFINAEDYESYNLYIEQNLGIIIDNPAIDTESKANIIYESARNLMENVIENPVAGNAIRRSQEFVGNTVKYIISEKDYFFNMINLTSHDYYTYTHSINVCIYSLSLARKIGINDSNKLNEIGTGALLHDIGKSAIPRDILLKKGPLTEYEWVIMKEHPDRGVRLLKEHSDRLSYESENIVRLHHEKLDGTGYPLGLKGGDISQCVRIVCIADIFDALNTNRPYKRAADTFHSLEIMNDQFYGKICLFKK